MFQLVREQHTFTAWKVVEREIVTWQEQVVADVLVREDGCKLILLENKKAQGNRYRYVKGEIAFEFNANRCHPGGTVTDTYRVFMEFKLGQRLGEAEWPLDRGWVEAFAYDIDSALRAWPASPDQQVIPVGIISFFVMTFGALPGRDISPGFESNHYTFALGRPIRTRHAPPSPRWQLRTVSYSSKHQRNGKGEAQDHHALVRDDGIQLIRIRTLLGPADDGPDIYHYSDQEVSFDFTAERRVGTGIVTDTWEVQLDPRRRYVNGLSPVLRNEQGARRVTEIIGNIEEALYAWPHDRGYDYETPINRVVFLDAD